MRYLIGILIALCCFASMVTAENIPAPLTGDGAPAPGYVAPSTSSPVYTLQTNSGYTTKVPVQRVAQLRQLEWWEVSAIDCYMRDHPKLGSSFRAYPEFLIRIDQSHVAKVCDKYGRVIGGKLNRTPEEYTADYQTFTQLYNRTDWYVNVPANKTILCLPDYCPPGSQGALCFEPLTAPCAPAATCGTACPTGGAASFYHEGSKDEWTAATYWFGKSTIEQQERRHRPPCPPPTPPTCPPGHPPGEQNPSGCNVLPTNGTNNYVPGLPPPPGVH